MRAKVHNISLFGICLFRNFWFPSKDTHDVHDITELQICYFLLNLSKKNIESKWQEKSKLMFYVYRFLALRETIQKKIVKHNTKMLNISMVLHNVTHKETIYIICTIHHLSLPSLKIFVKFCAEIKTFSGCTNFNGIGILFKSKTLFTVNLWYIKNYGM